MTDNDSGTELVQVKIPKQYRCAVALTYDTDMAHGYSPLDNPGCHGRTAPFVADYMRRQMDDAERFDARLHFFKIVNGLEEGCDYSVYREALARGHDVDCHTYSHLNLAYTDPEELDVDLRRANLLLQEKLEVEPFVLRGPGGYPPGALGPDSRSVILRNGFSYVSGQGTGGMEYKDNPRDSAKDSGAHPPFRFLDGLVEIPFHGLTDRTFLDTLVADDDALTEFRKQYAHQPVPAGWRCTWTVPNALDRLISIQKSSVDYAYKHRLLLNFAQHPYSHYLHDPEHRYLTELLDHIRSKEEPIWVGTLRGVIREMLEC
ncbi:MAG: polysaccharide deacetylase family protein [SAR202 cluster bacterium]|jgi:peptidoglycan/xylan/chitin deacetylase (PgdA/CDA1 family)|nr:polysaccharide deacetylase family protein [SAR202 cluster bacterium]